MIIGINTLFYIPGEVGGSETYLLEILRHWKKSGRPEQVILFTQLENHTLLKSEFDGGGWTCELIPFRASNRAVRIIREQIELPLRVRKRRTDVLWSPGYTAPIIAGCPQAVTLHDMQYKRFPEDLSLLARTATHLLVQACARDSGKKIITISESAREEILRFTRSESQRISVVSEAADKAFRPAKSSQSPHPPYLLCVANTYPHKAVDVLVSAFGLLEKDIPHNLVLVGKPRRGDRAVQSAISLLENPDRVKRISELSRPGLIRLYQEADLFVFPSRYEGFGLPVLEAMQAGVPVLTTRHASIPEVGGDAVAYVENDSPEALRNSILNLIHEPAPLRQIRIERALKRCERFSWERTAVETLHILASLPRQNAELRTF